MEPRKNKSPYLKWEPRSPKPVNGYYKTGQHPLFPIHYILHPPETLDLALSWEEMIEAYELSDEPFISRYFHDVIDEPGALHLWSPMKNEDPLLIRAAGEHSLRKSRLYKELLKQGKLYTGTRYPSHNF